MQAVRDRKSAEVRSRIEPDLKEQSTEVLADLGLDLSGAIRLFLRQVVEVRGLPFEVRKPTAATIAAMTEARQLASARFGSSDELFDGLQQESGKGKKSGAAPKVRLHASVREGLAKTEPLRKAGHASTERSHAAADREQRAVKRGVERSPSRGKLGGSPRVPRKG